MVTPAFGMLEEVYKKVLLSQIKTVTTLTEVI